MNKSELDRYRQQGASALVDAYERLVSERDAIAAHVERLCEKITEYHGEDVAAEDALNDLAVIVADIPNQSLAERDAEVAKKAFVAGYELCESVCNKNKLRLHNVLGHAEQYANQLHEAAKGGEQ